MPSKNPTQLLKHTASRKGLGLQTCIFHCPPRLAILSLGPCSKQWQARPRAWAFGSNTSLNSLNPTDFQLLHVLPRATPPKHSYFPSKTWQRDPPFRVEPYINISVPIRSPNSPMTPNTPTMISPIPAPQDITKLATRLPMALTHGHMAMKTGLTRPSSWSNPWPITSKNSPTPKSHP